MIGDRGYYMELSRIARTKVDKAKQAEASKDFKNAAALLLEAATTINKMASVAFTEQDRKRLHRKALQCREMAEKLAAGKPAFDAKEEPLAQAADTSADQQAYDSAIDDLIYTKGTVTWGDIGGMEQVKNSLKYTMGMLLAIQPDGVSIPVPSRILLYGPPGTGKTMLAAASANMLGATFFNVKASDLLSKYFGESSKLISSLYARARSVADTGAALIFMDEIDSLCKKDSSAGETGAELRIRSTLLAELDGLADKGQASRVITMAATNKPWLLDDALLQRFEKHFLVNLPDKPARAAIFRILLGRTGLQLDGGVTCDWLADRTEGCAGRNIEYIVKDVCETMISEMNADVGTHVDNQTIREYTIRHRPLQRKDFEHALKRARPTSSAEQLKEYASWAARSGG